MALSLERCQLPLIVVSGFPQIGSITKPPGSAGPTKKPIGPQIPRHSLGLCGNIRHLGTCRTVYLLFQNRAAESLARDALKKSGVNLGRRRFFRVPTDRGWMRDSVPSACAAIPAKSLIHILLFNGWAKSAITNKYAVRNQRDKKLKRTTTWQPLQQWPPRRSGRPAASTSRPRSLLTTEECLAQQAPSSAITDHHPRRLRAMSSRYLGVHSVLWPLAKNVSAGDYTQGHVDYLARCVSPHHHRHRRRARPARRPTMFPFNKSLRA